MSEPDSSDLLGIFQSLQSVVLATSGIETFLQQLSVLATGAADQPISCGITARRDGQPLTVAFSDTLASSLDETQYAAGDGPCLHTLATGETVAIDDVREESRWRDYLDKASSSGLRCSLSLPLDVDHTTVGAMNLYGFAEPRVFTPPVRSRCELFAAQASGALQIALGRVTDHQLLDQLDQALASRTVIDQAIGILMAEQRCTADEAFALLRMRSQSAQVKLRDVAADLITRVTGQPPQPGRPFDRS
ncbi:MAG TPA: GAF and ANTAR domain-containing protein [Microlunatus sp.]|nr:GAF and ANTAR domain-containing protein [Microlunatus sp.]